MSHNDNLMRAILGAVILRPDILENSDITDQDFSPGRFRKTFEAISDLWEDRPDKIDPLILAERIGSNEPVSFVSSLIDGQVRLEPTAFQGRLVELRKKNIESRVIAKVSEQARTGNFHLAEIRGDLEAYDALNAIAGGPTLPTTIILSNVESRIVPWLWKNFIPLGRGVLISGDPGSGKTWLTLDAAARLSRGLPWADGSPGGDPANTYYMTVEDDAHDTIRPRIDSLGGDPSRIAIYNSEHPLHVDLSTEEGRKRIENEIIKVGNVRLVVIDPILDFSGGVNPNAGEEVRALLTPLINMAARHDFALVMVGHLNKDQTMSAIYRAGGSTSGWLGKCRAAFMIFRDIDDKTLRHVIPIKANLAPVDPPQIEFRIINGQINARISEEEVNPEEHLNPQRKPGPTPERRSAAEVWLKEFFADRSEIPVTEIEAIAKMRGIKPATLRRAKRTLGIHGRQTPDGWVWMNPEGGSDAQVS